MPNDNLGTAHGSIRLDLDDRASGQLLRTLTKLSRQFDEMNRKLSRIEKAVKSTDQTFDHTSKSIDRTTRATKGFTSGIFAANKSITRFTRDFKDLYDNFTKFSDLMERANAWYKPLNKTYRVLDQLQRLNFNGPTNSLLRFNKALYNVGVYSNIQQRAFSRFFGLKEAMREMPTWTQNLNRFAIKMAQVGTAGVLISKLAARNPFERFLNTKAFERLASSSEGAGVAIERFVKRADHDFNILSRSFNRGFAPIRNMAANLRGFLVGAALVRSGVQGILDKFAFLRAIPTPILRGLAVLISTVLPVALSVFSRALTGTSNLLLGLLDGVKQLSGGLLVLPGIFASIGAVASSLGIVFVGLKDKFKDVFSDDPGKALEAYWQLPQRLRPLADVLIGLKSRFKDMQEALQGEAFAKVEQQIQKLADGYLPLFAKGATQVIVAIRGIKDEFVGFLGQQRTMSDVATIYSRTAETISNLKSAIQPALEGLRDIAVVGTGFIRDMSATMPGLVKRFQQWAEVNRNNGNLLKWMQDARAGFRDLIVGVVNLTKGLWALLTIFRSNQGSNFLQSFADSMERFNNAVQRSAASGTLRNIGNAVRDMLNPGDSKMSDFKNTMNDFTDMLKNVWEVVKSTAEAFSAQFLPALRSMMQFISFMAQLKHSLGLDEVLGTIFGLIAAWKIFDHVTNGVVNVLKVLVGTFLTLRNSAKLISFADQALSALGGTFGQFGAAGKKLQGSLLNVRNSLGTILTTAAALVGPLAAIAIAIGGAWLAWEDRNKAIKSGLDAISDSAAHTKQAGIDMKNAFIDDQGLAGRSVMDTVSQSIDTMFSDLQNMSSKAPGIIEHIGDRIRDAFTMDPGESWMDQLFGSKGSPESDAINQIQKAAADAERAQQNFKRAGVTQDDLSRAVMGSAESYQTLRHRLSEAGDGFNEAIQHVDELRKQYQDAAAASKQLGDGGVAVAAGIRKIADAGGDATSKLEGLKQVLEGLGLLKTTALEAAAAYEKGIDDLASSVQEAVANGASLDDLINKQTGTFNVGTDAGRKLFDVFKTLGDEFMATAAKNGNAQQAYKQFTDQLDSLSASTGLSRDQLIKLGQDVGLLPKEVDLTLQLAGQDTMLQDLGQVILQSQAAIARGGPVEIAVGVQNDPATVAQKINDIIGRAVARTGEAGNIILDPTLSQADLDKILTDLAAHGIGTPGHPATKATIDVGVKAGGIGQSLNDQAGALTKTRDQVKSGIDEILNGIAGVTGQSEKQGEDAGTKFVDAYAAGLGSNPAARDAARRMAEEVLKQFHRSPPKEGPLAKHGDAAKYGGEQFGVSYASGITGSARGVGTAAATVAAAASGGLKNDKGYQAGRFLGQISDVMAFAEHAVDAFTKIAESVANFGKFLSDPQDKGTFFGKSRKWKRDSSISDTELAKTRADAAQQRIFGFFGSGQRPDLYDPQTGQLKGREPGNLAPNANQQDIANYIIDKAMSQGYTREQANQFVVQAVGESSLSPKADSGATGWKGIFQFDKPTWESAGGGDVMSAQQNIDNYFKLAQQRGLTPQTFTDPHQLGTQVSIGGPLNPANVGHEERARAAAQQYLQGYQPGTGQTVSGIPGGVTALPGNMPTPTILHDTGKVPSSAASRYLASIIQNMFPEVRSIGGSRDTGSAPGTHEKGLAIDIGMPGGSSPGASTPSDKMLGDRIQAFIQANAAQLGVRYTIWQGVGTNTKGGAPFTTPGQHFDHIDVQFNDGTIGSIDSSGSSFRVPYGSPFAGANYGLPPKPEDTTSPSKDLVVRNPDPNGPPFIPIHQGTGEQPGNNPINPLTGKPYTSQEAADFWNRPENAMQFDQSQLQGQDLSTPGVFQGTQEDLLNEVKQSNSFLAGILDGTNSQLTEQEAITAATQLQTEIDRQTTIDTPESRARASALQGVQSGITSEYGLTQEENPFDQAASIIGNVSSIAGDIFKVVNSYIEAVGATKDITETLVRYPANTEDIFRMIDDFQKYIQLGADIAGAVSSIAGTAGSFTGGADFGATKAIGAIAGMIQGALETWNAMIDLGQEAYRIIGSYVGDFLGYLVGGAGGPLQGNIKFLLDEQTNQLLSYSADNPLDKRAHTLPFEQARPDARNQVIGELNYYAGPGQDPRDSTRQMMFQVRASQLAVATGQ